MAQPVDLPGLVKTYVAGEDLSAKQYCWVYLSGDYAVSGSSTTQALIGILQNAPTSGKVAEVMVSGCSKAVLGGTVAAGDRVGSHTDSTTVAKASDAGITGGVAEMGGASGAIISVLLTPNTQRAS